MALSAMDCVLNGEQAVYCSNELTSGFTLYEALRRHGLKTEKELRERLGDAWYRENIFNRNAKAAAEFAAVVRANYSDGTVVITPGPFFAPRWIQPEYLYLWQQLLRTRIRSVWFNRNWEYSNGCTFEFAVALDSGVPTFKHDGQALDPVEGIGAVEAAVRQLESEGFSTARLRENLELLHPVTPEGQP